MRRGRAAAVVVLVGLLHSASNVGERSSQGRSAMAGSMAGSHAAALRRSLVGGLGATLLVGAASTAGSQLTDAFNAYIARGYREIATFAATKVDSPAAAAHFRQRAALVAAGSPVEPEAPDAAKLDAQTLNDAE